MNAKIANVFSPMAFAVSNALVIFDEFPLPASGTRYSGSGEVVTVSSNTRQQLRAQLEPTYRWLEQK